MDTIRFISLSAFLASWMVFASSYFTETHPKIIVETRVEFINPKVMTNKEKVEWCKKHPPCMKTSEAVVFEARSEPLVGMRAVAAVIKNRKEHKRWANTLIGVVEQPHQFSYLQDMHSQNPPLQKDWERAMIATFDILNGVSLSPVGDAVYYHTTNVKPYWTKGLQVVAKINNHVFYKEAL